MSEEEEEIKKNMEKYLRTALPPQSFYDGFRRMASMTTHRFKMDESVFELPKTKTKKLWNSIHEPFCPTKID
jgi:hypothetical protein